MKTIDQAIAENPTATDAEILAAVNASRVPVAKPIAAVNTFLLDSGILLAMRAAEDALPAGALRIGVRTFLGERQSFQTFDPSHPVIASLIAEVVPGLQQATFISAEQVAAFSDFILEAAVTLDQVSRHRRALAVAPHLAAAGAVAATVNAYVSSAQSWIDTGLGEMPTWGDA